ncbi:MAG: DUF3046 domain-containing protein [Aeromicrobium sp.]|nr:MAG: DUF3046 domain-containing protein [Aeromicrobium sp.]
MRHSEFWDRMFHHLGDDYAEFWGSHHAIGSLASRTAMQALEDGVEPLAVWRAVHAELELPHRDR